MVLSCSFLTDRNTEHFLMDLVIIYTVQVKYFYLFIQIVGTRVCLCVWVYDLQAPEKERALRCPGAGVAGSCGPPDMGSGNQTWSSARVVHALNLQAISSYHS